MSNDTHLESEEEIPVDLSKNHSYLNPISYMETENSRLAKLAMKTCFYFYIYYPKSMYYLNPGEELPPPPPVEVNVLKGEGAAKVLSTPFVPNKPPPAPPAPMVAV